MTIKTFLFFEFLEYQHPDIALNSNCTIPIHPVAKRTSKPENDVFRSNDELHKISPSCLKESENYYPDCFNEYGAAFAECESSSNCVGIVKHTDFADEKFRHAPEGYYLCLKNFIISESYYEDPYILNPNKQTMRSHVPKEVHKKKKEKGIFSNNVEGVRIILV